MIRPPRSGSPFLRLSSSPILLDRPWLAIFSLAGIMETAFPPDAMEGYLAQAGFTETGTVEEFLK